MLKKLNRSNIESVPAYPERIVQFGAGNFLRAFADWAIQELNEQTDFDSSVVVVKVTPGTYTELDEQDGLYHVYLQGIQDGQEVTRTQLITCISRTVYPYDDWAAYLDLAAQPEIRFLISNTTEAGISYDESDRADATPPSSFPAKLALFLCHRYQRFNGGADKGCIIIPTELVEDNGTQLQTMILRYAEQWGLEAGFMEWVQTANIFCNTLVDRIVPGYPKAQSEAILAEAGYEDDLLVMGELYHSWIIEAPDQIKQEFPVDQTDLNIKVVADAAPYRETKVRILNGAHSSMVPIGYLLGLESVRESMEHPVLGPFLQALIRQEVIPSMDLPADELEPFAADVFDRFRNPGIHHRLLSIAVNSSAKVKTRLVPSIKAYASKYGEVPPRLVIAMAAFIRMYKGQWQGETVPLNDDPAVIDWFRQQWQTQPSMPDLARAVLQYKPLWDEDLSQIPGLQDQLSTYLQQIDEVGLLPLLEKLKN
ncbi:tagaturonate reductase [Phototrophicus methaneseepsis]|uniref:Tagaturonate reductase n=1 Tax=Phototrophicus methaneseepsis TaxID=2710758 RepID=A0A7S8IFZ5_9CHLR|nr:tagaturonate reductase [Phototrophicus methaneseepsis]QPC84117.1 tagaturonate reductase [Phototrophicus methaneseepsis]